LIALDLPTLSNMETITNAASTVTSTVATTVSKVIWGEQTTTQNNETAGEEPISGQQGKGTVNEPYDQGNAGKFSETPTAYACPSHSTL
jgi:hypothetical protein